MATLDTGAAHQNRGLHIAHTLKGEGFDGSEDGTGRGTPLIPAFAWPPEIADHITNSEGKTYTHEGESNFRLHNAVGHPVSVPAFAFALRGREGGALPEVGGDKSNALRAASGGSSRDYVAQAVMENIRGELRLSDASDASDALTNGGGKPGQGYAAALVDMAVRRLIPRECERLQGFDDDYTLIYDAAVAADGPRYKSLGNTMAVPVMRRIGERIQEVDAITHQVAP